MFTPVASYTVFVILWMRVWFNNFKNLNMHWNEKWKMTKSYNVSNKEHSLARGNLDGSVSVHLKSHAYVEYSVINQRWGASCKNASQEQDKEFWEGIKSSQKAFFKVQHWISRISSRILDWEKCIALIFVFGLMSHRTKQFI